jgi:hypothetical protein
MTHIENKQENFSQKNKKEKQNKHEKEGQIRTVGLRSLIMDDVELDLSTPFNYYCIN